MTNTHPSNMSHKIRLRKLSFETVLEALIFVLISLWEISMKAHHLMQTKDESHIN